MSLDEKKDAFELFGELLQMSDAIEEQVSRGISLADLLGLESSDLDGIQSLAKKVFSQRRYHESADLYLLLVTLDPSRGTDWLRLGTAEHLGGRFEESIDAYGMAAWVNPEDPIPNLHLADVFIARNDLDSAVKALTLSIECAGQNPNHAKLLKPAARLRNSLLKRQGKELEESE